MKNTNPNEAAAAEVDERFPNTPIGIVRSRAAFLRDLPTLLANPKYDRWCVAYCGDERIGIAETPNELIGECKKRGLREDDCFIGCITPHGDDEEEVDYGFCELDED